MICYVKHGMRWVKRNVVAVGTAVMVIGMIVAPLSAQAQLGAPDLTGLTSTNIGTFTTGATNAANFGIGGIMVVSGILFVLAVVGAIIGRTRSRRT